MKMISLIKAMLYLKNIVIKDIVVITTQDVKKKKQVLLMAKFTLRCETSSHFTSRLTTGKMEKMEICNRNGEIYILD